MRGLSVLNAQELLGGRRWEWMNPNSNMSLGQRVTGAALDLNPQGALVRQVLETEWGEHPKGPESFVPVFGSAQEAVADANDGDYLGALGNGVLAVTDVAPMRAVGGAVGKSAIRGGKSLLAKQGPKRAWTEANRGRFKGPRQSTTWNAVAKDMKKAGIKPPNAHGHHWGIPQNGWGKSVPNFIKNQPINIKVLPEEIHRRIHGSYKGAPRFDPARRFWYGTPDWAKAVGLRIGVLGSEQTSGPKSRRSR